MKKLSLSLTLTAISLLLPYGCDQLSSTITYTTNEPVYLSYLEFRSTKAAQPAKEMVHPGKICLYGNYLFINEIAEGIHIIDNTNPSAPKSIAFIELIGNLDLTVNNNILYADSFIDLVLFDVTNPAQPVECGRVDNVFPNVLPATGNTYPIRNVDWNKGVVIGWEVKTITEKEEFQLFYPCPNCGYLDLASSSSWAIQESSPLSPSLTGITGSMSRFAVYGDYLYVVNNGLLTVFSLYGNAAIKGQEQYLSWNVETIFPYNNMLFLGTTSGMMIYGLTNPSAPNYLSSISHIVGCDPVVVQGDYAYVTIRGGNTCGQNLSLLEVIDISNPSAPVLRASYNMSQPYGLGIDGNTLFVCDQGLTIFDATNPIIVGAKMIMKVPSINGFDVIPYNGILILIGSDGLYLYDYSDINNIKEMSAIKVSKN